MVIVLPCREVKVAKSQVRRAVPERLIKKGSDMVRFDRILFPVDFSLRCRQMAPYVAEIARKFSSEIVLLHALDPLPPTCYAPEFAYFSPPGFIAVQRQSMSAELARFAESEFPDLPASHTIMCGDPAAAITTYAAAHQMDVIMMPTHGRGLFRRLLLGSVLSKVLHDTSCPVWTTAHCDRLTGTPNHEIRRILCAIDVGIENVHVLSEASEIAREFDATVHLLHALPSQEAYEHNVDPGLRQYLMRSARERIAVLQREAGTDWPLSIRSAYVSEAVRKNAEEIGADLAVIGRGHVQEHFGPMRTHAMAILRESPCPVLSV